MTCGKTDAELFRAVRRLDDVVYGSSIRAVRTLTDQEASAERTTQYEAALEAWETHLRTLPPVSVERQGQYSIIRCGSTESERIGTAELHTPNGAKAYAERIWDVEHPRPEIQPNDVPSAQYNRLIQPWRDACHDGTDRLAEEIQACVRGG